MPDNAIAAGVDVNPLRNISNILGIKQQQQNLQTGQYVQQQQQAEAQQKQQAAQEMRAAIPLMQDPVASGLVDQEGKPTPNAYSIIKRAMPFTGDAHYKSMLDAAAGAVQYRSAWNNLRTDEQSNVSSRLAGVAADPKSGTSDILSAIDDIKGTYKGTPAEPDINQLTSVALKGINGIGAKHGVEGVKQYINGLSRGAIGNAGITGAGGVATPATGANLLAQPTVTNRVTGATDLAQAGQGAAPTPAEAARQQVTAAGGAGADVERSKQISDSVSPSRSAITLADQISNLADQVHTGKWSKSVTDFAATIGQDNPAIAARQLISKYAAQLKTVATANAPTDSARAQIDAGFPDPEHMSPAAIKGASEYIKGGMLMNLSRAKLAREYASKRGGDTSGLRYADDSLTQNADPLMYTYQNLKPGAERQEFVRRHFTSAEQAAEFVHRKNAVEHYGGFGQ